MVKIYSEWDIGLDYVFSNKDVAIKWLKTNLPYFGIKDPIEELLDEGLVGFNKVEYIDE